MCYICSDKVASVIADGPYRSAIVGWNVLFQPLLFVRPARTYSNGCKSPSRPNSGKATAESKGIHREVESEGSRRQTSDLTYRNLIRRLKRVDKSAKQDKVP